MQIVYGSVELEMSNPINFNAGHWVFDDIGQQHSNSANTPNYGNSGYYRYTSTGISDEDADAAYDIMVQVRQQLVTAQTDADFLFA